MSGARASGETVVRRSGRGWVVGDEEASDLTSAMVLADLLAADLALSGSAPCGSAPCGSATSGSAPSGSAPSGSAPSGSAPSGSAASSTQARTTGGGTARADTAPTAPRVAPRHARPMNEADEAARLALTVTQLQHALTARVRVEQAISLLRLPEELERKPEPRARIRSRTAG